MAKLSVSVFAADIMHVEEDLNFFSGMGVDSLHIDVMDGHFVPLFGYNQLWIKKIAAKTVADLEIHLMAYLNDDMLTRFIALRPAELIFHIEAQDKICNMKYLRRIKASGIRCGLALSPGTPCSNIKEYLDAIDMVLMMTTEPGCEESVFLDTSYARVEEMREIIDKSGRNIMIGADGALNRIRIREIVKSGVDKVIIGRAFYNDIDKNGLINDIHRL